MSSCHRALSPTISVLVRAWWRDGPPSTRYDATVNGPPANPMRGTSSISTARRTASITYGVSETGSSGRRRSRSPRAAKGCSTTGPVPGTTSTPKPTAWAGTTMSLNRMAASTP